MDRLKVIVVSYNNETTIENCLSAALAATEDLPCTITVVDNHSADDTAETIKNKFPKIEVLELKDNIGFGAANNLVLCRGESSFVLLLNPDTMIFPDAVRTLLETIDSFDDVALVAPRLEYGDGSPQVSFGYFPGLIRDLRQRRLVNGCKSRNRRALRKVERMVLSIFEPDWVSGSCCLARADALREVDLFDESFFLYLEDVDLCRRLRARGWRILVQPKARCVHLEGVSKRDSSSMRRHYRRSRLLYENKHGSRWRFTLYRLLRGAGLGVEYNPDYRWSPGLR